MSGMLRNRALDGNRRSGGWLTDGTGRCVAALAEQGAKLVGMRVCELPSLQFEPVVPVPASQAFGKIAADGQGAGCPLADDMTIFVQHQPGVAEELARAIAQVDAPATCRGDRAAVQSDEHGMLEDLHVVHRAAEQRLEGAGDGLREPYRATDESHTG